MARTRRQEAEEARQALLEAAERFVRLRRDASVILARGDVQVIRRAPSSRPPPPLPGEATAYELAVVRSLTDVPMSARRLARLAGVRHNSYFRGVLSRLVEAGRIRRTRRGYSLP